MSLFSLFMLETWAAVDNNPIIKSPKIMINYCCKSWKPLLSVTNKKLGRGTE